MSWKIHVFINSYDTILHSYGTKKKKGCYCIIITSFVFGSSVNCHANTVFESRWFPQYQWVLLILFILLLLLLLQKKGYDDAVCVGFSDWPQIMFTVMLIVSSVCFYHWQPNKEMEPQQQQDCHCCSGFCW